MTSDFFVSADYYQLGVEFHVSSRGKPTSPPQQSRHSKSPQQWHPLHPPAISKGGHPHRSPRVEVQSSTTSSHATNAASCPSATQQHTLPLAHQHRNNTHCLLPISNAIFSCLLLIDSNVPTNQFAPGAFSHATTLCPPAPFSFYHPLTSLTARVG